MKRRSSKFSIPPKYILRICIVLCIGFIFLSFRYQELLHPLKTFAGTIITPMQKGINTVGSYLSDKLDAFQDVKKLVEEKEQLEREVERLKAASISLVMDQYELDSLRALYSVGEKYADYPKVAAHVTSKDSNSYYNIFTIDKGMEDGIEVDMNVLAGNGLCGIVIEVGKNYAKVRSIIDDASYVSGMFLRTSDTCDVKGDLKLLDSGYIRVEAISPNAKIEDNYEVVTSHISNKYLPGILIGFISHIETDASNLTKQAYLTPVVDFEHLEEVLVITQQKEPFEELTEEAKIDRILEQAALLSEKGRAAVSEQLNNSLGSKAKLSSVINQLSKLSYEEKTTLNGQLETMLKSEGKDEDAP